MSRPSSLRPLLAVALAAALSLHAAAAHADPVALPAAHLTFTPPEGWSGRAVGPQVAQFSRAGITVDVLAPVIDATHTVESIVRELQRDRALRATWRGRPSLRVVQESRGAMQHGTGTHDGAPASLLLVWAPLGGRLLVAMAYLSPTATGEDEGLVHQLIDTVRLAP